MRSRALIFTLVAAALFLAADVRAGNSDLEIHIVPRQVDEATKKAGDGGAAVTKEHWAYEVTVENKTFNELQNLEVKYQTFVTREQLGVKAGATPQRQNGSFSIPSLKAHEKKTFTTQPVELAKKHLVGNWIYRDGAKPNATDALVGLWVRVMQNGQQFAEYANPSTLLKEKWE